MRKNKFVEILPINVGCLGACTYCKTKHARGHLGSYTVDSLVSSWASVKNLTEYPVVLRWNFTQPKLTLQAGRVRAVVADGVKEIWLSSEDTGAYGMMHHFVC